MEMHARQRASPPGLMLSCMVLFVRAWGAVRTSMQEGMQEGARLCPMQVPVVVLLCQAASLCMHMRHVPVAVVCMRGVWPCLWPHAHVCMVVRLRRSVCIVLLPLLQLLLHSLLVLLLRHPPALALVCITHSTLCCRDGGAVCSCIKGLQALEGHLLACTVKGQQYSRRLSVSGPYLTRSTSTVCFPERTTETAWPCTVAPSGSTLVHMWLLASGTAAGTVLLAIQDSSSRGSLCPHHPACCTLKLGPFTMPCKQLLWSYLCLVSGTGK